LRFFLFNQLQRRCALLASSTREIMKRQYRSNRSPRLGREPRHSGAGYDLSQFRAAADADDGADPRDFFKKENPARGQGRKTQQLCQQVSQTLQQVLGEAADVRLQALLVTEVAPAPDASQLLVLLTPLAGGEIDFAEIDAALASAGGWLRSEVAAAIHRKRAPSLVFRVLPAAGAAEVQP
jgi:ribosome-binding factor A